MKTSTSVTGNAAKALYKGCIEDIAKSTAGNESVRDRQVKPTVRDGERFKQWFRANRAFCVSTSWYFSTREGVEVGPFDSKDEAESAIAELGAILSEISRPLAVLLAIDDFQCRWKAH